VTWKDLEELDRAARKTQLDLAFNCAKLEVHDGDIIVFQATRQLSRRELEEAKETVLQMEQDLDWKERNIASVFLPVEFTVRKVAGPVRAEPARFSVQRAISRAEGLLAQHGFAAEVSNIGLLVRAIIEAIACEQIQAERDEDDGTTD
jgi:hypothetical protein